MGNDLHKTCIISERTKKRIRAKATSLKGTPKQIAYLSLRQEGHKPAHVEKMLGLSGGFGGYVEKRLNPKYSLISNIIVKGAFSSLKKLSLGKPVGNMSEVKGSDVLGACKEIYARAEPTIQKIQSTSLSLNLSDATAKEMLQAIESSSLCLPDVINNDRQGQTAQDAGQGVLDV